MKASLELTQQIILLLLFIYPFLSVSWPPGSQGQKNIRLSARKPLPNGSGGQDDAGPGPVGYPEPIPWVILLRLPEDQNPGRYHNGEVYNSEEKAKYFEEMVNAVKSIRSKGLEGEYWARGPSGAGEADIWYFCLVTSFQEIRHLEQKYGDLIAYARPLSALYPARRLQVIPQGFIRNRRRIPVLDNNGKILPRNLTSTTTPNPIHGMRLGKREVTGQLRAPRELRALGVPPWMWGETGWDTLQYCYDRIAGRTEEPQVIVYVICKGVDITHPEFNEINQREMKDWIRADPYPTPRNVYRDYSWGAGTAVFGKIFGKTVGIARQAKPVIVVAADKNGKTSRLHILDSLLQIHADITRRRKGRKVVISMSWILTPPSDPNNPNSGMDSFDYFLIASIRHILEMLSQLDVAFVVPGGSFHLDVENQGNNAVTNPIVGFPANEGLRKWDINLKGRNPFITVGGVDMTSWDNYYQSHLSLRVSAPAVDILVPLPSSPFESREVGPARAMLHTPGDYGTVKGTAYAAATVAGLLAYFLAMGFNRDEAKTIIYAFSYPRVSGEARQRLDQAPRVIYNGIWGICKGGESYWGSLTGDLPDIKKRELVKIARSLVRDRWPEELSWELDDSDFANSKRSTDPAQGDPAQGDLPPPLGLSEGPGEAAPPVYRPEDSWERGHDPEKGGWVKCPVEVT
ncbi:hypothetical protein TWF506_009619 [Arthrobotrys conoides]|uniref:Peptidase S8/S53 domain-containing protein n=1 Tax=Arthrobotrys conoides TaxID=74498 RepID=A0AAN8NIN9_9PEZI